MAPSSDIEGGMRLASSPWLSTLAILGLFGACSSEEGSTRPAGSAGDGGSGGSGGSSAGKGGSSGSAGNGGTGGTPDAVGGLGGDGGDVVDGECGDPSADGVIVYDDVDTDTTWECPVYTLTRPIFVRSSGAARTRLRILPGVTVRGVKGDLDAAKFPGALIVTRTGRLEAIGTAELPVVFTSAQPLAERAPGDWGGVALLGRAPTNVPASYEGSGTSPARCTSRVSRRAISCSTARRSPNRRERAVKGSGSGDGRSGWRRR